MIRSAQEVMLMLMLMQCRKEMESLELTLSLCGDARLPPVRCGHEQRHGDAVMASTGRALTFKLGIRWGSSVSSV